VSFVELSEREVPHCNGACISSRWKDAVLWCVDEETERGGLPIGEELSELWGEADRDGKFSFLLNGINVSA
jgi:hypothetical protein